MAKLKNVGGYFTVDIIRGDDEDINLDLRDGRSGKVLSWKFNTV